MCAQEQRKLDMKRIWTEETEESLEEYYKNKYGPAPTMGYVDFHLIMVGSHLCVHVITHTVDLTNSNTGAEGCSEQ